MMPRLLATIMELQIKYFGQTLLSPKELNPSNHTVLKASCSFTKITQPIFGRSAASTFASQQYITKHSQQEAIDLALALASGIDCMLQKIKAKIEYS